MSESKTGSFSLEDGWAQQHLAEFQHKQLVFNTVTSGAACDHRAACRGSSDRACDNSNTDRARINGASQPMNLYPSPLRGEDELRVPRILPSFCRNPATCTSTVRVDGIAS
jgi:hypothetical protein